MIFLAINDEIENIKIKTQNLHIRSKKMKSELNVYHNQLVHNNTNISK